MLDQVVDGVADAGGPYAITEGDPLTLDGTASLAGPGATYSWDVNGDGTFGDATGASPTLTWTDLEALGLDGDTTPHTVTLRLTDVLTFTAVTPLTIANVAPTATFDNDGPVRRRGRPATVTFSAQADPSAQDLAALTYSYDFNNDGDFEIRSRSRTARRPRPWYRRRSSPTARRTYTIHGRIADDDGGSLDLTTDISVTNAAATATITGPSTATVGVPVTLKVGADDPSPGDMAGTFDFTVDWGDGSPIVSTSGPADPPVTHTYTTPGTFTVTATVDRPGWRDERSTDVRDHGGPRGHHHDDDDRTDHHAGTDTTIARRHDRPDHDHGDNGHHHDGGARADDDCGRRDGPTAHRRRVVERAPRGPRSARSGSRPGGDDATAREFRRLSRTTAYARPRCRRRGSF